MHLSSVACFFFPGFGSRTANDDRKSSQQTFQSMVGHRSLQTESLKIRAMAHLLVRISLVDYRALKEWLEMHAASGKAVRE
jgi:hypothetical protein